MSPPPLAAVAKLPPASKRTLSLFTGLTDAESDRARDGSHGEELTRRRADGRPRWEFLNLRCWTWVLETRGWHNARIEREADGRYTASVAGETKTFASVIDAAKWAERRT